MYYTIYQTTNLINGKVYIGAHKTDNLEDNYIGSGNPSKEIPQDKNREKYSIIERATQISIRARL